MSSLMSTIAPDATEAARRPLQADHCALIVVDIQEKLLPPIFNKETKVPDFAIAESGWRISSRFPSWMTNQYSKGLGSTVPDVASLLTDVRTIDKLEFGCFGSDEFAPASRSFPAIGTRCCCAAWTAHLRDANGAGRAQRWISCPRCLRCGRLALGVELEGRSRPHAPRRRCHLLHRDGDVRVAPLFGNERVQRIAAVYQVAIDVAVRSQLVAGWPPLPYPLLPNI